jgi:uncharacterized protein (TIGR02300 family)
MPAKDLGTKYSCYKCQTKFYDMKKPDPICPKCGADQRESPALKPASETRRGRLAVAKQAQPAEAPEEKEGELLGEEDEELGSFDDEEAESGEEDDV